MSELNIVKTSPEAHTGPMRIVGIFPGLKWSRSEASHSPSSSAEVKNGGATPLLPHSSSWRGAYIISPLLYQCTRAIRKVTSVHFRKLIEEWGSACPIEVASRDSLPCKPLHNWPPSLCSCLYTESFDVNYYLLSRQLLYLLCYPLSSR
jgi:hypothetical protein